METLNSSASISLPREPASFDEVYMNQSILFSDSLMDLKNLRNQLYAAAEYFELSYTNDDQKQIVMNTLKDYTIKALVNTVDHLGSVSYKVNDLLDEKADEVSVTELRVSCIEQRLRSCQEYIDRAGLSQQTLVINIPKYHKRYIMPVAETMTGANDVDSVYRGCSVEDEDDWLYFKNAVQARIVRTSPFSAGKGNSLSASSTHFQQTGRFSLSDTLHSKRLEKRTVSAHRFPPSRSGSVSSRSTTPKKSRQTTPDPSRPITPNSSSIGKPQKPSSELQRSVSMRFYAETLQPPKNTTDHNHHHGGSGKGKRLLKALLSRRKSKRDDMLYTYLDEY